MNPSVLPGAPALSPVYSPPQYAPFPVIMYCFATVDYFSSFWAGGSRQAVDNRRQTPRMVDFLRKYLHYPDRESVVAIDIWRHKLMHTSEPRIATAGERLRRVFGWQCGPEVDNHMRLQEIEPRTFILPFACNQFVRDLHEGVFGPNGYFTALQADGSYEPPPPLPPPASGAPAAPPAHRLQTNFQRYLREMRRERINLAALGL